MLTEVERLLNGQFSNRVHCVCVYMNGAYLISVVRRRRRCHQLASTNSNRTNHMDSI